MKLLPAAVVAPLAIIALSLAGCAATPPAPVPADGGPSDSGDQSTTSENSENGSSKFDETGGAIVNVDGELFEYSGLGCELDYAASDGKTYAWAGAAIRTSDERSVNFQVGAFDPSGQGRVSGDGVTYNIVILGYGYPVDSPIDVNANGTTGVTISGDSASTSENTVKVSGQFVGADGTTHSIKVDAQCASSER